MQKLFSILRCSLWCKNYDGNLSADVLCNILKLAKEQTVLGLVFDTLNDIEVNGLVDKMPIYDAIGKTEQIKQQNRQTNHELVAFADKCDNCGQNYIVVKGQTIASIYPNPALRQPGDIDFLVPTIHNINHNISKLFPGVVIPKRLSVFFSSDISKQSLNNFFFHSPSNPLKRSRGVVSSSCGNNKRAQSSRFPLEVSSLVVNINSSNCPSIPCIVISCFAIIILFI